MSKEAKEAKAANMASAVGDAAGFGQTVGGEDRR
jgi:hypothetical protein